MLDTVETPATEVANKICKAQVCAEAASAGEGGLIRALLLLIPCPAVLKAAYKYLVLQVARVEAQRFSGVLEREDIAPNAGTGKRAVIIPLCVPILNAV